MLGREAHKHLKENNRTSWFLWAFGWSFVAMMKISGVLGGLVILFVSVHHLLDMMQSALHTGSRLKWDSRSAWVPHCFRPLKSSQGTPAPSWLIRQDRFVFFSYSNFLWHQGSRRLTRYAHWKGNHVGSSAARFHYPKNSQCLQSSELEYLENQLRELRVLPRKSSPWLDHKGLLSFSSV